MSVERKPDSEVLASLKRKAQFLKDELERDARISETEASDEELGYQHSARNLLKAAEISQAAFERHSKEASGSMTFPEDDSDDWERFIHWLYKRKLQITSLAEPTPRVRYADLIDLYILADKYGIGLLKNHIMRCLSRTVHHYRQLPSDLGLPSDSLVERIYNLTTGSSKLRQFVATCYAWGADLDNLRHVHSVEKLLRAIPDFAADVACLCLVWRQGSGLAGRDWFGEPIHLVAFLEEVNEDRPRRPALEAA
ncbi:MAG: hypothetical protein Q9208_006924 [Pyrenodesmia sp. 3 TL-2023]